MNIKSDRTTSLYIIIASKHSFFLYGFRCFSKENYTTIPISGLYNLKLYNVLLYLWKTHVLIQIQFIDNTQTTFNVMYVYQNIIN